MTNGDKTTAGARRGVARRAWAAPTVSKLTAAAAENGRLVGGEALVLLS